MTELAQEQKATPPEVIMGHVKRSTNGGDIIFINTELVTPKVIDIMVASINEMVEIVNSAGEPSLEGHGLYSVVFRDDGRPRVEQDKLTPWLFVPDSKSAVCNLADCVELAFINTMDEDKGDAVYCNVAHVFWKHLITGFFHEAHHAEAFITDYDELIDDEDARQVEEFKADEFADLHSFHMAKLVNMEPEFSPRVAEMLNEQWVAYKELITEDKNADDHAKLWLQVQIEMQRSGASFFMPAPEGTGEENFYCNSFKEFMRHVCPEDMDSPDWDLDTTGTIEVDINIPAPNITAEGTPAAPKNLANINPVSAQYMDDDDLDAYAMEGHDDEDEPTVAPIAPTVQVVAGMQGVAQQFAAPVAPIAPTTQATPVGETVYQPVGYVAPADPRSGQFQATVKGLYLKMFHHLFRTCGYNPQMPQVFGQKEKIVEMLPLTVEENAIVAAMDRYNEVGKPVTAAPCDGWISGIFIDKAMQLPGYNLTLTTLEGIQIFRKFVPQNPNKVKYQTTELTKGALDARAGNQIMWIIDPLADKNDKTKSSTRVCNGVFQKSVGWDWVAV